MPFHYPGKARERILVIGGPGTGKTTTWVSIAKTIAQTKTDAKVYVIDSDDTAERMIDTDAADAADVIEAFPAYEWQDYTGGIAKAREHARPQDWLVVDMTTPAWDAVQEAYIDEVFSKGRSDFFLEARKAGAKGQPLDGWKDWSIINGMYRDFTNSLLRWPGQLLGCAGVDAISGPDEDKDIKLVFGPFGVKPRGQKHTAHIFHSVLWMQASRPGQWKMTTVKDRGRELWAGQDLNKFSMDYLVKTAGWKLA